MSEKKYTFSCYLTVERKRLKRRPWWNLFGRDSLESYTAREGVYMEVNEEEAKLLQEAQFTVIGSWGPLFLKALGHREGQKITGIGAVQLEECHNPTSYIETGSSHE